MSTATVGVQPGPPGAPALRDRVARRPSFLAALAGGALVQWRCTRTRTMAYVTTLIAPPMMLAVLVLTYSGPLSPPLATAKITGTLLATFWASSLWSGAGILRRERFQATLAPAVTGVQSPLAVYLGKSAGAATMDVAFIAVATSLTAVALGLRVHIAHPPAFLAGMLAVLVCGIAASILVGAALILSRHAHQLTSALGAPIMLLGGTVLPVTILPGWLQPVSYVINLSWLQRFLASCSTPQPDWGTLAVALAISALYAAGGTYLFALMVRRARKEASLDLV